MKRTSPLPSFFRLLPASIAAVLLASAHAEAATLTDRYVFGNSLADSVGSYNGTGTSATTYTEAVTYATDAPTGAVNISTSLVLGMNSGTKVSGFSVSNAAITESAGSVNLWIKPATRTDSSGADYILYMPSVGAGGTGMEIYLPATNLNIREGVATATNGGSATVVQAAWSMVTMTWDNASGTASLYVNSVLATTLSFTAGSFSSTAGLRVGNFDLSNNSTNLTNQFAGELYDLQIYSGVLTTSEISSLYANPGLALSAIAVPEPSTVAFLLLGAAFLAWASRGSARHAASNLASNLVR